MRKLRMLLFAVIFLCLLSALAIANGLNLNSLGSRALAMGGAFVGLADDFSTIYWNPAGMAYFDKRYFGFYGTDVIPSGTYKNALVDAKTETMHYLSGLAAYYLPLSKDVVAALGLYIPSGLGSSWDGADFAPMSMAGTYQWMSKVSLITIAPALSYKVNDRISVGAALNINHGTFSLKMHAGSAENPAPPPDELDLGQYEESMTGWGYGATLGVLFKPLDMVSIGATFRTASTVKFSGEAIISNLSFLGYNDTSDLERDITWPMWIAAGVAVTPTKSLTLTADLQWTQWSKIDVIKTRFKDVVWALMMGESGDDQMPMYWEDRLQVRFGAEYWIKGIAIRAGYYYDPSPVPDKTMNFLLPSYDFNVITLGFGYGLDSLELDFSLEYLMGKERAIGTEYTTAMPGTYTMKVIVPNLSIGYRF